MATPPTFSAGAVLTAAQMNQLGLFLIKTVTVGSGTSVVPVTDCFSSDYDNYKILISGVNSTGPVQLKFTLGNNTGNNYYGSAYYDAYTGGVTGANRTNNGGSLDCGFAEGSLREQWSTIEIGSPNLARSTSLSGSYYGATYSGWFSGTRADTTQYTGFNLVSSSNLNGGTIRVYGYRN
jgi:hypothetical protein